MISGTPVVWAERVMVVGVCRMGLALPGNNSLKGKRSVVRRILDRSRNRFNVAAAEIGDLDNHRRITLGFAVISNESRHANSMLDKLASFVTGATEAVVISQRLEIIPLADEFGRDRADLELESFKLDDGSNG